MITALILAAAVGAVTATCCPGDLDGDRQVSIGELMAVVRSAQAGCAASRPACPGDCNEDGQVTPEEFDLVMAIYRDGEPACSCPAADADGDGVILYDDVAMATRALWGGGCRVWHTPTPVRDDGG